MAKLAAASPPDPLLRELLTETDESAAAALFVQLCQQSPALRRWLWEDFAKDAKVRERFAARVRCQADEPVVRISELGEDAAPWRAEIAALRSQFSSHLFGGLTWRKVESLIGQLRAGRSDLAAFLLALQWRRAGKSAAKSPHLLRMSASFVQDVLASRSPTRLNQLATAMRVVDSAAGAKRRASVGFSDWWKLQLLTFMLHHPRESYRTRELAAHLKALGLAVSAKEIRRFCSRHGIRRDMRAGRPKKTPGLQPAPATRPRPPARRTGRR